MRANSSEEQAILSFTVLYMQFQHFVQEILFSRTGMPPLSQKKSSVALESYGTVDDEPLKAEGWLLVWLCVLTRHTVHILDDTPQRGLKILRGPGFLAVVWFRSTPAPLPILPSASCLSFSVFLCVAGPADWREMGEGGRGAESTAWKKAWPSISASILSDAQHAGKTVVRLIFLCCRLTPLWHCWKI